MALLIQLLCWVIFGFIGFKAAENYNEKYDVNFDPRIWASIGFLFGVFGILGLICYAYFKTRKVGK